MQPHENGIDVPRLVTRLVMSSELEWIEFKHNNHEPQEIGQYISAIANAAALHDQQVGFVVWGIADGTHEIVGTTFCPRTEKKGGELLESWLSRLLSPKVDFRFHEGVIGGRRVVVLEIPCAAPAPVRFDGEEYIRIGSSKKKLRDHWEKERKLWSRFSRVPFENGTARHDVSPDEVLELLAYAKLFELLKQPVPSTSDAIIARLEAEGFVRQNANGGYDITNLGAISFGQRLSKLGLERKAVRLVVYAGEERFDDSREYPGGRGYASSFEALVEFVDALLPTNEVIEKALRAGVPMYPMLAVRELIANALIHQDFSMTGTGPMIEVFSSRIEITNPGLPLIDPQRFLDATPRSRNEKLAMLMRRIGICEERGTGVDKVVRLAEMYQLPAPNFRVGPEHTVAVLYAPRPLAQMDRADRIRACYQHAVLQWMAHRQLTNASLRERLGISDANSAIASRLIADTLGEGLIKPEDPENRSRKHARYIPFFA